MKVNNISNLSFSSRIDGDLTAIKKMAIKNGLPANLYKYSINKIQQYFPENDITVKLYNRFINTNVGVHVLSFPPALLQKVKVIKDHNILGEEKVNAIGKYGVAKYLAAVRRISEKLKS